MTYNDALEFLFRQTRASAPRDPQRMHFVLKQLGLRMPPRTVHVVGTNGKGTVSALIAAGLAANGLKVGRFSSPHVEDFRERIAVNDVLISEAAVIQFVERVRRLDWSSTPAFFELCLALALEHFSKEAVDIAVIEAGVGAKKDVTSTLENVELVVITNVALDHQSTLGATVEAIARDKAAAIRTGVPVVTAAQGDALAVIQTVSQTQAAPLYVESERDAHFDLPTGLPPLTSLDRQNQRLASAALRLLGLRDGSFATALNLPPLPARREVFVIAGRTVTLDGGHNPAALDALLEQVAKPFLLVFAARVKKEGAALLAKLEPYTIQTIITTAHNETPPWLGPQHTFIPDPRTAVDAALQEPQRSPLVIAGSFYLAGEVRPYLRKLAEQTG